LAFFDFSLLSYHFWPFTEVLRKIFGSLTWEGWEFLEDTTDSADVTDATKTDFV